MKHYYLLFLITLTFSCLKENKKIESVIIPNDTITTTSGFQYYYLKKGTGRKVEQNSLVETKLSLMINDSVIWTSYEAKDSTYSFIVGVDRVIKGFKEMSLLMREGDNVVAILPDSLAYGDKGAGELIPPNTTIVYDRYEIVSVSEPKKTLTDTLMISLSNFGIEGVKKTYDSILNSSALDEYHSTLNPFLSLLMAEEKYQEMESLLEHFITVPDNSEIETLQYYLILSLENQNKQNKAIVKLKQFLEDDPNDQWLKDRLTKLETDKEKEGN